jgi:hypothetical protein
MIPLLELRALVGVEDDAQDELLEALELAAVDAVSKKARLYLGESGAVTDRIIGDGTPYLYLPRWPVTAVASITERYPFDAVPFDRPVTDFVLRDEFQLWRTGSNVWSGGYEYEVVYTAGYAVGDFPGVLVQAVKDIVALRFPVAVATETGTAGEVKKRETFGPYTVEFDTSSGATASTDAAGADASIDAILTRASRFGRLRT